MFDKAGFPRDSSRDGVAEDLTESLITHVSREIGWTNEWPSVFLLRYGTNDLIYCFNDTPNEVTNGFIGPIVTEQNPQRIYEAVGGCLDQIGVKTIWQASSKWLKPGEFELYVPAKNN